MKIILKFIAFCFIQFAAFSLMINATQGGKKGMFFLVGAAGLFLFSLWLILKGKSKSNYNK